MKKLISLLLIIQVTIISWSSFAKNIEIKVNNLSITTYLVSNNTVLKPSLSNQFLNESPSLATSKTKNNRNMLFEETIIFNEKLQQFIAFFTDTDKGIAVAANNKRPFPKNSNSGTEKCKANS